MLDFNEGAKINIRCETHRECGSDAGTGNDAPGGFPAVTHHLSYIAHSTCQNALVFTLCMIFDQPKA